jgi:drug/metabolite transporter (DMT)-like permease
LSDLAEPVPGVTVGHRPRAVAGYCLSVGAAVLFAINGTVSKSIMLSGIDPTRLSQLRVTAAFLVLLAFVAVTRPAALRIRRDEWVVLLCFGILGVAMTQYLYFVAIKLLPVGIALLIEFTAPIMVAMWFRFGMHERVDRRVWLGLALALAGLALVGQVWEGFTLDLTGVLAGFGAAAALALYFVLGDRQVRRPQPRDPVSLTMWGFGAAALFWAVAAPWWSFPWTALTGTGHPLGDDGTGVPLWVLITWMVLLGTVLPFALSVQALRNIRASQASVVGMTEPLIASAIAWFALGEVLAPIQIVGAIVVLAGVLLAELSRSG